MKINKIIGILLAVIGAIGEVYALMTINSDKNASILYGRYTYAPPFTDHEITYITIAAVSALLLIVGLIVLFLKKGKKE
ncbi:MAG: hypothetical protein IKJ70_04415 [Clostridia bacterium]|nr:hypothetical protein [Clostridia bacterium]